MKLTPKLNRRLILEERVQSPDGAGGFAESWNSLGTVWAEVKAGIGREKNTAGAVLSTVPYRIVLRASPVGSASRPRPDMRFRDGVRLYRILAVADREGSGLYLECFTKEEAVT